tara:strand:+ start:630 stop:890 length:261 start_codon:yes stop_codon:yes gene_type:complete
MLLLKYKQINKARKIMGMSNWILDNEEQFWNTGEEVIAECEVFEDFVEKMQKHAHLLNGSPSYCENAVEFENMLADAWSEKWSKYY